MAVLVPAYEVSALSLCRWPRVPAAHSVRHFAVILIPGRAVDVVPDDAGERLVVDSAAVGEAEPLHHRLRGDVVGQRDGKDQIEPQCAETVGESGARDLGGVAMAPGSGMQRPQNLGRLELG